MSMFPWAAQRGATIQAEVRGSDLDDARAVWFDAGAIEGRVLRVEKLNEPAPSDRGIASGGKEPQATYRAAIEVRIGAGTETGIYSLRIVTGRGLSNGLRFEVTRDRVEVEKPGPHPSVEQAQAVTPPATINGRLGDPGESDFYSFQARAGQALSFEVMTEDKYDPVLAAKRFAPLLALYRAGGSWFDPHRPSRLLFAEEASTDLMPVQARGTYRFQESGRYFLEISGLFGQGGPECSYQLKIAPPGSDILAAARQILPQDEWVERSFGRQLAERWPKMLEARTTSSQAEPHPDLKAAAGAQGSGGNASVDPVPARLPAPPKSPVLVAEREPNDGAREAQEISIPSIVEGAIGQPGDVDSFKFTVEPGQKLAFEIETPDAAPPYFNPRLGVVDSQDDELLSNVHRRVSLFNNNADRHTYLKTIEPKAVYTFDRGGQYILQVRDITSRYAGKRYRYRVLVRAEEPHLGEISVLDGDQVNLVRGKARKLVVLVAYEEGFSGEVLFSFQGLPEGVQALPGTQFSDDRPPMEVDENPNIVIAKEQKTTVVLVASNRAPLSVKPEMVRLECRPVVNGEPGASLPVRVIPLMVVENRTEAGEGGKKNSASAKP